MTCPPDLYLKNDRITHHEVLGEIKLDITTKALFILFLRHPEGISKAKLPEYIKEMREIFLHMTNPTDFKTKNTRSEGQVFDFFVKRSITCPRDLPGRYC